jgi:serine/threonine protein kinase/formylglycine-generating enzyme required for sulfatase activity
VEDELDDWSPPDSFEEYKLVRRLGRGTMGMVYLARDRLLDRLVAVKFITELEPLARDRFVVEARAAARIQHPNVVAVYRVGELGDRPYLISEYVRGQSLAELPLPLPWSRALELGVGLARGLAAAHRQGVLHRDIKLANAMLSEAGEIKLLDFSLAKLVDAPAFERLRGHSASVSDVRDVREVLSDAAPPPLPPAARLAETITLEAPKQSPRPPRHEAPGWPGGLPDITAVGALVGTPHYMAPELWRGEPASRASDVYALGVLLYALCSGRPPHDAASMVDFVELVQEGAPHPLGERVPDVDRRFAEIIERCIRADPALRYGSGEELREALETLSAALRAAHGRGSNPYRGLQVFDAAHRDVFFGRGAEIAAVLARLRSQRFVLVAGDSGVGKSSLCRAGVIPAVCDGKVDPSVGWTAVKLTPGRRPLHALVAALARALGVDEARLHDTAADPARLVPLLAGGRVAGGVILFVDQLEELITLAPAPDAAAAAELLGALARGVPRVLLLATVRGDFLTRVAPLPGFGAEILRGLFFLYPLSPIGVRQAIVDPVQARGVRFESDAMVQKLVTAGVEGSLPLLQFALAELWEARAPDSHVITAAALDKIGGVSGALARHAEGVLARLTPAQRRLARTLLLRLVTIEETRASMTRDELTAEGEDADVVLDALSAARLILIRDVPDGPPVYEIAHEALILGWVSLRVWLDEEREDRAIRHRLELAAAEWERLGHPRHALWRSAQQLEEMRRLEARGLRPRELAFLAACAAAGRRARWLRRSLIVGTPALIALVVLVVLLVQRAALRREIDGLLAASAALADDARALDADVERHRVAAFAAFDDGDESAGEAAWHLAVRHAPDVQQLYARAAGELETALGRDPGRLDVRRALGDVLLAQALLAERDHDREQAAALLLRVALHDPDGARMARWHAPARVTLTSEPPGARVTMARYARDHDGRLALVDERDLGETPLAPLDVAPGSYLWSFSAPERGLVRYPAVLRRGEPLAVAVALPPASEVPAGFVVVPGGRSRIGSDDDDELRRSFFTAPPMHEVEVDTFLIATHETTYAEWLEFLDALPPAEQERRSGRRTGAIFQAAPTLTRGEDGQWQIEVRTGDRVQTARRGEPIHYPRRNRRKDHDWLRLPVTGISWDDADAYLKWLDATARVPGARFCSEHEWERAARGADGRSFPTGADITTDEANFDATYGRDPEAMGPDAVGTYADVVSPFGLHDTTGNVWEWVDPIGSARERIVRGGCFFHARVSGHSANRSRLDPNFFDGTLGLRVCATPHVGRGAAG